MQSLASWRACNRSKRRELAACMLAYVVCVLDLASVSAYGMRSMREGEGSTGHGYCMVQEAHCALRMRAQAVPVHWAVRMWME